MARDLNVDEAGGAAQHQQHEPAALMLSNPEQLDKVKLEMQP